MDNDIEMYVKSCTECQMRKSPNLSKAGLLVPVKVGGLFECWGIDILGAFPTSSDGNRYIIVATEYLSKFAEIAAVPKADKFEVSKFIDQRIIFRYGAPNRIISDQGKVFASNLCKLIYASHEIKHVRTSSYHPQSNVLVEHLNKCIAEI